MFNYQLSSPTSPPYFCFTSEQVHKTPHMLPLLALAGSSFKPWPVCVSCHLDPTPNYKKNQSHPPLLLLGACPVVPRSLIISIISILMHSWCVCSVSSLDIQTSILGEEEGWLYPLWPNHKTAAVIQNPLGWKFSNVTIMPLWHLHSMESQVVQLLS